MSQVIQILISILILIEMTFSFPTSLTCILVLFVFYLGMLSVVKFICYRLTEPCCILYKLMGVLKMWSLGRIYECLTTAGFMKFMSLPTHLSPSTFCTVDFSNP